MRLVFYTALALLMPAAASAQVDLSDPLMFAERVYEYEIAGTRPEDDSVLFAPELVSLFKQDAAAAEKAGEVGIIDADVLCACQDSDGLRAVPALVSQTPTTAVVSVRLTFNGAYPQVLTLQLERLPQGWRIADIVTPGANGGSLLERLRDGLSDHPKEQPPAPIDTTPDGCVKADEEVRPAAENCKDIRHVTARWRVARASDAMNYPSDQATKVVALASGETIVSAISVRIGTRIWLQVQKGEFITWVRREALMPLP